MSKAKIFYFTLQDEQTKEEKLDWFERTRFEQIPFDHITPDQKANWINLTDNDFDSFLPLIDKEVKAGKSQGAVFQLFSRGLETGRDEWVYDFSEVNLTDKVNYLIESYQTRLISSKRQEFDIKWDRELEKYLSRNIQKKFEEDKIRNGLYRPFSKQFIYFDSHFNRFPGQVPILFERQDLEITNICFTDSGSQKPFMVIVSDQIPDLHVVGAACSAQCLPLYRYDENGSRIDNITDWALEQFRRRYLPSPPQPSSPTGEEGAGHDLPSPAGEGQGERVNASGEEQQREKADQLVYVAGARRNIPEQLLLRAKELRQKQTPAEKILWECLRANRLHDAKFRRQHNIGQYIADFYCHAARLVIELDGEVHKIQKDRDGDRDAWMQAHGLTVLRFKNTDLSQNLEQVLQTIADHLPSPPQPSSPAGEEGAGHDLPSPAGEGQGERGNSPAGEGQGERGNSPAGEGQGERGNSPAGEGQGERAITKEAIFHYTYAVLHHPAYRVKYELNLKREFPRLPFYADFQQWATWGKALMDLHLNYETVEPYGLRQVDVGRVRANGDSPLQGSLIPTDTPDPAKPIKRTTPKAKLKADKIEGKIILDTETTLEGVPAIAWDYKLGNRSALEWILDQYKEKTPKDPTIAKLFNTYKFADYKEHVIDLLQRVCTVSVRTMEIIQQMPDTVEHQSSN